MEPHSEEAQREHEAEAMRAEIDACGAPGKTGNTILSAISTLSLGSVLHHTKTLKLHM